MSISMCELRYEENKCGRKRHRKRYKAKRQTNEQQIHMLYEKNDGQQFRQYRQNERSPLILTH